MKKSGKRYFTADEYRRLSRNPFVDKKTLQFVKNKTLGQSGAEPAAHRQPSAKSSPNPTASPRGQGVQMSESTAQLIAMALRAMLRE